MPGFAPLAAAPLASAGLPPGREAFFAGVFALGTAVQGRTRAHAVARGAVVLAGQAQGRIFTQAHAHATGDTRTVTLAGQSRGTVSPQAYVDRAVSVFGAARTAAHAAAASTATIIVDSDAWAELTDTGRITSDYVAQGQAAGVTGTTSTAVPAIAINLDCAVSPSNEGLAAGAIPFTARQGAKAAITARTALLWQAERHIQVAITAVDGQATQPLSLDVKARSFAKARAIGVGSMALTGTARLTGTTNLRAQDRIAVAGRGKANTNAQATLTRALTLAGNAGARAQEDRNASSTSNIHLSGNAIAQAALIGQTSCDITLRAQATADTAVLGHGLSDVSIARRSDAATPVDAAMARTIIFSGASAALIATVTSKTITAHLPLSGHARVQVGTDVAAATAVPIGIACAGRVGLTIGADLRLRLPSVSTASTGLNGTTTKAVILAGIANTAPRTTAQIAPTPLALTGIARATLDLVATSDGQIALTRLSRTSTLIEVSTVPGLHLHLQSTAIVTLHGLGRVAIHLQGVASLSIRINAMAHGLLGLVGAGKSAVVMRAIAGAGFELAAVTGAEAAARGRALDRFTVTRMGAGDTAVRGDAARLITFTGQSAVRVRSRALAQRVVAPNLHAAGTSGLHGKLSAQAVQPDGTCQASMKVDAALHDGSWPLTLQVFGVRAPPGQRRFTPPDTAQGGSVISVPRSGVLRAKPRTGRILKG